MDTSTRELFPLHQLAKESAKITRDAYLHLKNQPEVKVGPGESRKLRKISIWARVYPFARNCTNIAKNVSIIYECL